MKIRRLTVCEVCRSRKLGCDGRSPACSQCLQSGRECPGYHADFIFRPLLVGGSSSLKESHGEGIAKKRLKRQQVMEYVHIPNNGVLSHPNPVTAMTWSSRDILSLCVQNLVPSNAILGICASKSQICASWIEIIHELPTGDDVARNVVPTSIRALGEAVLARGCDGIAPISSALNAQSSAIREMQRALRRPTVSMVEQLVVATMCLLLSEMILHGARSNHEVYVKGMLDLFQLREQNSVPTSISYRLFGAVRSILVAYAFLKQTSTFLVAEGRRPQSIKNFDESHLQSLLSEASEVFAMIGVLRASSRDHAGRKLVARYLSQWHATMRGSTPQPQWWRTTDTDGKCCIWFRDLTTAIYLTHLWAFWIACVSMMRKLKEINPVFKNDDMLIGNYALASEDITQEMVWAATCILQSVEYFTQPAMKLVGVSEISFPLFTAIKTLEARGDSDTTAVLRFVKDTQHLSKNRYKDILLFWST